MSEGDSRNYEPIRQKKIADRKYELLSRGNCVNCGTEHFEIWRWSGASFARYKMPSDFIIDDFEAFIENLDEQLLESSDEILEQFYEELLKLNSPEGIEADYSFAFRLLEYGRQRVIQLKRLKTFDVLLSRTPPDNSEDEAIRAAFELGFAASQHRMMVNYEDYVHDGIAMSEWRQAGLPRAREERLRQGGKTRLEIINAAKRLYEADPALIRNDCETARQIIRLRLPALQKGNGQQLGLDAITRHLRDGRRKRLTKEN